MREIKLLIRIDEKTNRIAVVEEQALGIPEGIDKELYMYGIYQYLLNRMSQKIKIKNPFRK